MAVQHQVWIRFKDGTTPEQAEGHMQALRTLKQVIPAIEHISCGANFTDRSGGFTHGLLVTVADRAGLATYLEHPDHVRVATAMRQDAQEIRALDYETSE